MASELDQGTIDALTKNAWGGDFLSKLFQLDKVLRANEAYATAQKEAEFKQAQNVYTQSTWPFELQQKQNIAEMYKPKALAGIAASEARTAQIQQKLEWNEKDPDKTTYAIETIRNDPNLMSNPIVAAQINTMPFYATVTQKDLKSWLSKGTAQARQAGAPKTKTMRELNTDAEKEISSPLFQGKSAKWRYAALQNYYTAQNGVAIPDIILERAIPNRAERLKVKIGAGK